MRIYFYENVPSGWSELPFFRLCGMCFKFRHYGECMSRHCFGTLMFNTYSTEKTLLWMAIDKYLVQKNPCLDVTSICYRDIIRKPYDLTTKYEPRQKGDNVTYFYRIYSPLITFYVKSIKD
jgi:hypothetical protein